MALGTPTDGGAAYSAGAGGTTVTPAYPAGIGAGDVLVLIVGQKPSTANGGTVTTPSGWTLRESLTGAGGYGATLGADTGNTNLFIYTKDTVAGTETGNLTVTVGTNNVCWGIIVLVPAGNGEITYGSADGSRTTAPTSGTAFTTLLTNGATAPNLINGDVAIWAMCIPTDVLNNGFTAPTISSTGTTFGTAVELEEPDSGNGNDIGGYVAYAIATAGSSTAAPTVGVTATGTVTNVRGPIALLRIREDRNGSLAATETGADTFSASGDVLVQGSLAASETGSDVFAASGNVIVSGALAVSETGADTFSASGTVSAALSGSLAATEVGSDTFAATGDVIVQGALAASETGSDTFAATGDVIVQGTLAATETGSDTFAATGDVLVQGTLAATETGADTFAASGTVLVEGTLAATETGSDTFFAAGEAQVTGSLSVTETGSDTFSASGTVSATTITGTLAASETGNDVFAASGNVFTSGVFAAIETGSDVFTASGTVLVEGTLAASETGNDVFAASGTVLVEGTLAATEDNDTFAAVGSVLVQGALAASETGADAFASSGKVIVSGALAASEAGSDVFAANGTVLVEGSFVASETGADVFTSTGVLPLTGTLAVTEQADVFGVILVDYVDSGYVNDGYFAQPQGVSGTVLVQGSLAATEVGADTFAATSPTTYENGGVTHRPDGVAVTSAVGSVTVNASAGVSVTGVAATAEVGILAVEADAIFTISGVSATVFLGTVDVYENEIVPVSGFELTTAFGSVNVTTTAFDFEAVKNNFDRNRLVYVDGRTQRYIYVEVQPRTIYIDEKPAVYARKIVIDRDYRQTYVNRGTTSKDRTVNIGI